MRSLLSFIRHPASGMALGARASALLTSLLVPATFVAAPALAASPAVANLPAVSETGDQPKPAHWPMKWDIGVGVGFDGVSKNTGLGNSAYRVDPATGALTSTRLVTVGNGAEIGLRGTAWLFEGLGLGDLGVELEGKWVPTTLTSTVWGTTGKANIFGVRAMAIYKFLDETFPVRPFVNAGGGVDIFKATDSAATLQSKNLYVSGVTGTKAVDTDGAWMVGGGAQWQPLQNIGVRADARFVSTQGLSGHAVTPNFEGMLAFVYTIGGKPGDSDGDGILDPYDKCPDQAEDRDGFSDNDGCPELDNDGDGIVDADDKCPNDAEDKDGFQDFDGCPDLDNDGDGIADNLDKCPNQAEDKDGFQDTDGCPDPDNDNDGILDAKDKCPNTPEDKDGFQDDDGCPDPDNDNDGVLDAADKCPNQPESKNLYQDQDGCPDTIPEDLQKVLDTKFTGAKFHGITLDEKASEGILKPIVEALAKHESVKVTVKLVSYTEDAAGAQARAEAVKQWLQVRGVDPARVDAVGESLATVAPPVSTGPEVKAAPAEDEPAATGKKGKHGKKAKKAKKAKKVKKAKKAKAGKKGKHGKGDKAPAGQPDVITIQLR
jgi:opacity protein-like surface antigen/outer membrane protein OmpA-like peptidoglycan-associated protein